MSLTAPLFLLGLLALALPLWLHRQRVRNAREQPFSSAMLLEHREPRMRMRRRWQYLALLALRVLLLIALCVAFAQPFWRRPGALRRAAALQVLVLDTSLSMGAEGHFERARAEARRLISQLGSGQKALLVAAADTLTPVSGAGSEPTANGAALRAALAAMRPGAARLDYGTLMASLDGLLARQRGLIDVHFISDFQASGTPRRFADLLPPASTGRTLAVQLHPINLNADEGNWAVTALGRAGADILVTVRGFHTPAATLQVALEVNGRSIGQLSEPIVASGQVQFRFHQPVLRLGDNRVIARLHNRDALAADNVRFAVIRNAPVQSVPLLTRATQGRAAKYLATALAAAGDGYAAQTYSSESFDVRTLPRYRWLLVDDLGALDDRLAQQLRAFVENGGALFTALGQQAATLPHLPLLGDAVEGSAGDSDAPLAVGQIDAGAPLLAGLRGWEDLNISHLLRLVPQPADRVLVGASNGDPLLLERRLGRGRVLLYASDLDDDWNDLPLQPLFVGLMAQAARYLSGRGEIAAAQTVGATLALGREGGPAGQLVDPSGRTVLSLADTSRALTVKFDQSGFYQIYTPAGEALVAVNPDPLESDLAPMSAIQLTRWRSALAALDTAAAAGSTRRGSLLALAPLWLGLLVVLVLGESLLGNYSLVGTTAAARRPAPAQRS